MRQIRTPTKGVRKVVIEAPGHTLTVNYLSSGDLVSRAETVEAKLQPMRRRILLRTALDLDEADMQILVRREITLEVRDAKHICNISPPSHRVHVVDKRR